LILLNKLVILFTTFTDSVFSLDWPKMALVKSLEFRSQKK